MIAINRSDALQLFEKISCIERTIHSLKTEVEDLKKLMNQSEQKEQNDIDITENPKKRKLHETEWGKFITDKNDFVQVFIACSNDNGNPVARAGIGVWFGHGHPLNLAEVIQRAQKLDKIGLEIEACIRAIEEVHLNGVKKLCINSDEKYLIDNMIKRNSMEKTKYAKRWLELNNKIKEMEHVRWTLVNRNHGIVAYEAAISLAKQISR